MRKYLTYKNFIALTKQNYQAGGITFVETWTEEIFNQYISIFGEITKQDALELFQAELCSIPGFILRVKQWKN